MLASPCPPGPARAARRDQPHRRQGLANGIAKGQATFAESGRHALGVDYGGAIAFGVDEPGVPVHRADAAPGEPAIESFPVFLADDSECRPRGAERAVPRARRTNCGAERDGCKALIYPYFLTDTAEVGPGAPDDAWRFRDGPCSIG
jgi:antitoxin PrlF